MFPVEQSIPLPSCLSSWALNLWKGRLGSRGHLVTYQGAWLPSCPRDPRQTLATLRKREKDRSFEKAQQSIKKHQFPLLQPQILQRQEEFLSSFLALQGAKMIALVSVRCVC